MTVRSPAAWLAHRAVRDPRAPAVTFGEGTWTFAGLHERARRAAAVLRAGGVEDGDRVGTLAANHPDLLAVLFACSAIGAVLVPLNMRLSAGELAFIAADAELSAVVADPAGVALLAPVGEAVPSFRVVIAGQAEGWAALDGAASAVRPDGLVVASDPAALSAIVYTSGTTGRPKGAMLTNANLWANDLNWMMSSDISRTDVALIVAPMFHVSGLYVLTLTTLLMGGRIVLLPGFEAGAAIEAVETHRVTTSFGVPAMMLFMSQHPRFATADLSSLRLFVAGGAPVPEPLLRLYAERGIPVSHCYGLSEATTATTFLETARAFERLGSAGRSGIMAELKLVDGEGRTVETPGEKGEICVRGGNVSPGYWRNPQATAKAIDADGWLRTGDVGYLDADGFLFVCDRVKDMVISGGENVYPAEVESVLFDHPAVAGVAVIGRPDARWGERVTAVAVLRPGMDLTLADVDDFCRGRLARYKVPRELHLLDELPLNGSGKVVKARLREMLEEVR